MTRWERLFDDLEGQLRAQERVELSAEIADRTRRERAQVRLLDRLASQAGPVEVMLRQGHRLSGVIEDVGADWLTLVDSVGRQWLIPAGSILCVTGPLRDETVSPSATTRRFAVGYALRVLARDRFPVSVFDLDGGVRTGTIDQVGSDWFELAEHALDVPRRSGNLSAIRVVSLPAVVAISVAAG